MKTVRDCIAQHARERPDTIFLIAPETGAAIRFADLKPRVDEIGARLQELRIAAGGKVAFMLNNGLWTSLLFLGVMASRRVIVPLNAVAGLTQLEYVLEHSDAEALFISPEYREQIAPALARIARPIAVVETTEDDGPVWPQTDAAPAADAPVPVAADPALLLYTSGTTGRPKGAILSHRAVVAGGRNVAQAHCLDAADRALCVLPIYHINGAMVTVMAPLASGGSVVMPKRLSIQQFWTWVADHGCSWSSLVPTVIKYLLDRADREPFAFGDDEKLKRFHFARSASAALPPVMLDQWEQTFKVPMIETLGLTETAGTVLSNPMPPAPHKPGSVGVPYGNEADVMDAEGHSVSEGTIGEVVIRGENVMEGYYKNPEATAEAFFEAWFRTGDQGYRDKEGYYFLTGRIKELIIRGGENIAPREIDEVLYRHEAVLEAAAVGVPDDNYGQEVVACVVRRDGGACSEQDLIEFCAQAIGAYKAPKRIYFMDDLPKGPSGKIQRLKLPDLIPADSV